MIIEIGAIAAAYVAGCVSPAVGRKLKAALAKGEATVKADVQAAEKKL
jgi:hypothetical protein